MNRIVYTNPNGSVTIIIPTRNIANMNELAAKDVPAGATNVRHITTADLPQNRLFRMAWDDSNPEDFVGINLDKAKEISHGLRQAKREEEFAPYDEIIAKQVPGQDAVAAENARQAIRDRYATIQINLDAAETADDLESILITEGII